MTVESHPLTPFLPSNGRVLFLGSFPPPKARWSMEWFYPNWNNDFWRMMGLVFFDDKCHFQLEGVKRFDYEAVVNFCSQQGFGFYDMATRVERLKDNASDNFLNIIEPTDVSCLLSEMPDCHVIVTTGGKASEELLAYLMPYNQGAMSMPVIGENILCHLPLPNGEQWEGRWYRMPSTSRAYPLKLDLKAEFYRRVLCTL